MDAPKHGRTRVPMVAAVLLVAATAVFGFSVGYGVGIVSPAQPGPGAASPAPGAASVAPGATPAPAGGSPSPGVATVEVRSQGDDAGPGTADRPWRTLAHALASIEPGTTVRLGAGTFDGAEVAVAGTRIVGAGEATVISGGLTVRADGVEVSDVTLTGQPTPYSGGITVTDAADAVITRTVVTGNPFGIYLADARNALVEANRITGNGYGIEVHGATDGTIVRDNDIVDNDRPLDASRGAGGLNLYFTTGGITITGNRIVGNDEVAIEIYAASDVTIDDNRVTGSNDMIETGTEAGAPCRNLSVTRNTFFNDAPDDPREERGVYVRCASDSVIEWNTFAGLDRFAIGLYAGEGGFNGPVERLSIRHNILAGGRAYSLDSALPASLEVDRNVVMPCRTGNCPVLGRDVAFVATERAGTRVWSDYQGWTGFDADGVFADPEFLDASRGDYRLAGGSPAAGLAGVTEAPEPGTSAGP